jgi:signal transduction histidine kinase
VLVACDAAGGRVEITVASSGQDVAPGDLPRLFERLHRLRGRGMGRLHLVRGLVEANRGAAWAESGAGRGLAIHLSLPAG